MPTRKPAGGAATAGGMNFQYRVTAWVAVRILAEKELSLPWALPEGTTLEWLRCETEQPVDDLMVKTSEDGFVFSQIKRSLNLSERVGSDFATALNQFVRQFVAYRASSSGKRPWERPLDPGQDRLVLIIGPNSSIPIRVHVPAILERLRGLANEQSLEDAAANNSEQKALSVVVSHIRRAWRAALGSSPTDHEMRRLLSLIRVQVLDIDNGGDASKRH
jgi:hypothetical protein